MRFDFEDQVLYILPHPPQFLQPHLFILLHGPPHLLKIQLHLKVLLAELVVPVLVITLNLLKYTKLNFLALPLMLKVDFLLLDFLFEVDQLLVKLAHFFVNILLLPRNIDHGKHGFLVLVVRHTLLLTQRHIPFQQLINFDYLRHLNMVLRQIEILQLVIILQINQCLRGEGCLKHVVGQVQGYELIVVLDEVGEHLDLLIRYHVLRQIQMLDPCLRVYLLARIHVQAVGDVAGADLRNLIVSKAYLSQAHVVAEATREHIDEPVVDVARVQVQDLERRAYRQVVGHVLRRQPILEVLRELENILIEDQLLQLLLLVYLCEDALQADDGDADASQVQILDMRNAVIDLPLALLHRFAYPGAHFRDRPVGPGRAKNTDEYFYAVVTNLVVTQVKRVERPEAHDELGQDLESGRAIYLGVAEVQGEEAGILLIIDDQPIIQRLVPRLPY